MFTNKNLYKFITAVLLSFSQNILAETVVFPSSVLAVTATPEYKTAVKDAEKWIHTLNISLRPNLQKNVLILGYDIESLSQSTGVVVITVGAATTFWPTCIYRIGKISSNVSFFLMESIRLCQKISLSLQIQLFLLLEIVHKK